MKVTLEMPQVSSCTVETCAYNNGKSCHARAITIGDGQRPGCDTFLHASAHTQEARRIAGVGACKVTTCRHNEDFECMAKEISVGYSGQDVLCMTYSAR